MTGEKGKHLCFTELWFGNWNKCERGNSYLIHF